MKLNKYILAGFLTCAAVLAQGPPPGGRGMGRGFGPGGGPGFGAGHGRVVTGAPYSAEVNFTRIVTMSDGNTIQQTATGRVARDSQGRTYSTETMTGGPLGQNGPVTRISIVDPVAGFAYELNPVTKVATRRAIHQRPQGADSGPALGANERPASPDVAKVDLGTSPVNGVNAKGSRTTRTIPAGAIGNANPIIATTETWYSPDLQTVVTSKHSDPRVGQTTFALNNIVRSEPSASLFQVPAGYTITDAPRGGHGQFGPPPAAPQE